MDDLTRELNSALQKLVWLINPKLNTQQHREVVECLSKELWKRAYTLAVEGK